MLDPFTVVSLASSVVQVVDFSAKVCLTIKGYSGMQGARRMLVDALEDTESKLDTLRGLADRQLDAKEAAVIARCALKAEDLLIHLERFRILVPAAEDGRNPRWAGRRFLDFNKIKLCLRTVLTESKLHDFQHALNTMLDLATFQLQSRTE